MKKSKVRRDALDMAFEITRLIKLSPKREVALEKFVQATRMILNFPLQLVFMLSAQTLGQFGVTP